MSTWHGVMRTEKSLCNGRSAQILCTDTKCAHSVRGRPILKDEERFRNGLVRKPYERSLYERTFMLPAGVTFSRSQIGKISV